MQHSPQSVRTAPYGIWGHTRPRPSVVLDENSQVSMVVRGPDCSRRHDVASDSVTSGDRLMHLMQRQRRINEDENC